MLQKLSLSGNTLKFIAAFSMLLDHCGMLLFPRMTFFRILGRLAFPIFAFMVAEGCRYTRSKARYVFEVFALGVLCQLGYYFLDRSLYMRVLITFTLGILVCFSLQNAKDICFAPNPLGMKVLSALLFALSVTVIYCLNQLFTIDYGFWGCMLPVFPLLARPPKENAPPWWQTMDSIAGRVLLFGIGLLMLSINLGGIQIYSLAALVLLLLYSGKRGKAKMKYFFYIFYPAHLAILEGISMLVVLIKSSL